MFVQPPIRAMPLPTSNNYTPKTDDTDAVTKSVFDDGNILNNINGAGNENCTSNTRRNDPLLVHSPHVRRDGDTGAGLHSSSGPGQLNGGFVYPNPSSDCNININIHTGPGSNINSNDINGDIMNHSNHSQMSHHSNRSGGGGPQDNSGGGGDSNNPTTAMLDACIRDLSRRRMVMAQQAAATASAVAAASQGGGGGGGGMSGGPGGGAGMGGPAGMGGGSMGVGGGVPGGVGGMGQLPVGGGGMSSHGSMGGGGGGGGHPMGARSAVAASAMGIKTEPSSVGGPMLGSGSAHSLGGSGHGGGKPSGPNVLADYAGTAADSFAQAFVDRWASAHSKDSTGSGMGGDPRLGGPGALAAGAAMGSAAAVALAARAEGMSAHQQQANNQALTNNSYHSLTSEGSNRSNRSNSNLNNSNNSNNMGARRSSESGSGTGSNNAGGGNKQWWVCDFCKNKAFISRVELKEHEGFCEMNPMRSSSGSGGGPSGIGINPGSNPGSGPRSVGAGGAMGGGLSTPGGGMADRHAQVSGGLPIPTGSAGIPSAAAMSSGLLGGPGGGNSMHSMGNLSRAGSLGSSAHSMHQLHHTGMNHPAMAHHPAAHRGSLGGGHPGAGHLPHGPPGFMHPGMNPYMNMMCGDGSMMMGPHNMPYGMPPGMPNMAEAAAAAAVASAAPQRRKSTVPVINPELIEASKGPFRQLPKPLALALDEDKDWLTPLHCFVRKHCVEVFTATELDVQTPSKGKRKPIQVGQIGIRCPHCHEGRMDTDPNRERGSVYYPTSLSSIYNATMNLLQRHLHSCPKVPAHVMSKYTELKKDDARSGTSKKYWVESAKSLGFVDTLQGIKLSAKKAPPPPSTSVSQRMTKEARGRSDSDAGEGDEKEGSEEVKEGEESKDKEDGETKDGDDDKASEKKKTPPAEAPPLVIPADKSTATAFSYLLLGQMQPCVFTEADRLGKRKGLPTGFAGLACRHCFGGYGSGRFFPSSIKTLSDTSKTLNVLHNHMARCRKVPKEVLEELEVARSTHDDERAKMKFGSQKAFFAKIWSRLHDNRPDGAVIKPPARKPSNANSNGGLRRLSSTTSTGSMGSSAAAAAQANAMMRWNGMGMGGMGMNGMMMGGMGAAGMAGMMGPGGMGGTGAGTGMGGMGPQNAAMMQHPMMAAHMGGFAGDPQMMAQMGGFPPMGMPGQMGGMGGGMHPQMMGGGVGGRMGMSGMDGSGHGGQTPLQQGDGSGHKRSLDMLSSQANEMRKRMRMPPPQSHPPDHTDV